MQILELYMTSSTLNAHTSSISNILGRDTLKIFICLIIMYTGLRYCVVCAGNDRTKYSTMNYANY